MICRSCGRKLKDANSIKRGYGPVCWQNVTGTKIVHRSTDSSNKIMNYDIPGQMDFSDFPNLFPRKRSVVMDKEFVDKLKERTIEVETLMNVDISSLKMVIIAVYEHPDDYPDKCVARIYDIDRPTNIVILKDNIMELQQDIRKAFPDKHPFPRGSEDVKCLIEAWI